MLKSKENIKEDKTTHRYSVLGLIIIQMTLDLALVCASRVWMLMAGDNRLQAGSGATVVFHHHRCSPRDESEGVVRVGVSPSSHILPGCFAHSVP